MGARKRPRRAASGDRAAADESMDDEPTTASANSLLLMRAVEVLVEVEKPVAVGLEDHMCVLAPHGFAGGHEGDIATHFLLPPG